MARRIGDRRGLASVLMGAYWGRATTDLQEILAMVTEARHLAAELDDSEIAAEAMEWRIATLLALGEIDTARMELAVVLDLAARTRQPFISHVAEHYRSALALSDGRLDDAERAAERSRDWSTLLTGRDASGVYGIQMFGIRREQGRLAELAPVVRVLAGRDRVGGAWRPGFAALLAELGMADEARAQLARVRREGLGSLRESLWLGSLAYLADACVAVGDAELARSIHGELEPMAGTNVMIGHGVACYGSADRFLGLLAVTFGELDMAVAHLRSAVDHNRRMGARTWLAHSSHQLGRVLRLRGGPGDAQAADQALAEAAALAEAIGMPALLGRIRALGGASAGGSPLPDDLSPREGEILRLVARGLSNRAIGLELRISEHTAANHVRSILRKTRCANRTEATTYAHTRGLTEVVSGQ